MGRLAVRVTPKAGRDEIVGWRGDELEIKVTAAPEGGKANAAVCKVVADALGVPKTSVKVSRGERSRHKSVEVEGVDDGQLASSFGPRPESLF